MAAADTNRVSLFFSPEATWGEAPGTSALAPKMYESRMTGETLLHRKATVVSNTIRNDRMRDTISEVGVNAEGDINFELASNDWDLMIEAALAAATSYIFTKSLSDITVSASNDRFTTAGGSMANFVVGAEVYVSAAGGTKAANLGRFTITSVAAGYIGVSGALVDETVSGAMVFKTNKVTTGDLVIASATTISSAGFDFTTLGLEVGQYVKLGAFTSAPNNKVVKIAAIASGLLTFDSSGLTTQSADADAWIQGKRIKNGTLNKSMLIEKYFSDIDQMVYFTGMRVGSMSLNIESQQLVTGKFTLMGKEGVGVGSTISGSRIDAGSTPVMNATTNVGSIKEGGSTLSTALKSITLELGNNLRAKPKVGQKAAFDIGYGFVDVSGTLNAYFEDLTLYNKVVNHTQSSLEFRFTDADGAVMHWTLPKLFFAAGAPTTPGGNQDVMVPLEFTAVRDATTDAVVIVDLLAA